jgi:hypothetical protein
MHNFNQKEHINTRDVIEIVKESGLWELLTPIEKQEAIKHVSNITPLSINEKEIQSIVEKKDNT